MARFRIEHSYTVCCNEDIELPDGRTPDDIDQSMVKWGQLCIDWKDGETTVLDLNAGYLDSIDWKRPDEVNVYELDENDQYDCNKDVASLLQL